MPTAGNTSALNRRKRLPTRQVLAEGTAGAGTGVTVGNLEANTAYTIYVVAYAGDLTSEVASVGNTTAAAPVTAETDYYQDYQDGKDIGAGRPDDQ